MKDASKILENTETRYQRTKEYLRDASSWFHRHKGQVEEREACAEELMEELDVDKDLARDILRELTGDVVDPIVQVPDAGDKYVGILEYKEFDGAYGYVDYHDTVGKRKRVVCAQCVYDKQLDKNVATATEGDGSFNFGHSWEELLEAIYDHYEDAHDTTPDKVETGATLVSGSTIGGSTAWHSGNDGYGSGLVADDAETWDTWKFALNGNDDVDKINFKT